MRFSTCQNLSCDYKAGNWNLLLQGLIVYLGVKICFTFAEVGGKQNMEYKFSNRHRNYNLEIIQSENDTKGDIAHTK